MSRAFSVAISPKLDAVALALESGNVEVRCSQTRSLLFSHPSAHGADSEALRVAWASHGQLLASAGSDGNICLFDANNDLQALHPRKKLAYDEDFQVDAEDRAVYALWMENELLFAGFDDKLACYDVETGQVSWSHAFPRHTSEISNRNPNGKQLVFDACRGGGGISTRLLFALSNGSIALLDERTKIASVTPAHKLAVTSVTQAQHSPHKFASSSVDGTAKIWDARTLSGPVLECAASSRKRAIYGAQFLGPNDNLMTWAGESLYFYDTDNAGEETRRLNMGFPVLSAQERAGVFAACGDVAVQAPTKRAKLSRSACCDPATTTGGVFFGKLSL